MSTRRPSALGGRRVALEPEAYAVLFAALGDETRLALVAKLCDAEPLSIAQLTEGTRLTRQAVTKHLRVLEGAGVVRGVHRGRENRFEFEPAAFQRIQTYLEQVSEQWDEALARLKALVER